MACAGGSGRLDGCKSGKLENVLKNWKMTVDRSGKGVYGQDGLFKKKRLEMEPRCTGTKNRDPGSRRDQEFWCRGIGRQPLRHRQTWRSRTLAGDDGVDGGGKSQRQGGDCSGRGTCNGRAGETGNG